MNREFIQPHNLFIVMLVLSAVAQAHFIVFVIDEMTTVLQIRVFRVKPVSAKVII